MGVWALEAPGTLCTSLVLDLMAGTGDPLWGILFFFKVVWKLAHTCKAITSFPSEFILSKNESWSLSAFQVPSSKWQVVESIKRYKIQPLE